MTSLGVVGSGLMGRSLLFELSQKQNKFDEVVLFSSDQITPPCSLNSTAVVALRGVTPGHSPLGDLLYQGFERFDLHVKKDLPQGVYEAIQYHGVSELTEAFQKRFPSYIFSNEFSHQEMALSLERAYVVDPKVYLDWLLNQVKKSLGAILTTVEDMVTEVSQKNKVEIKTLQGKKWEFDQVIFAGGSYNRFWAPDVEELSKKNSRPVQGSYLEFQNLSWGQPTFSLTLDGDNLVWNAPLKRLLIGSTTEESVHFLADIKSLNEIYHRLGARLRWELPPFHSAGVKVGLREKAQKRSPYLVKNGGCLFVGGLYKNAYLLSLKLSEKILREENFSSLQ